MPLSKTGAKWQMLHGLVLLASLGAAQVVHAQAFPAKPVRIVVPFPVGGAVDAVMRLLAPHVSESWGQPVIVDNRVGAGGNIGTEHVANSPADGYTYLVHSQAFAANVSLQKNLPFHPQKDFAPVMLLASTNGVLLVPPSFAARSVKELVDMARAQPGKLSYATLGIGTSGHLNMALFNNLLGIDLLHVPYKNISQAQIDLIAGRVQAYMAPLPGFVAHIKSGKLRALGVSGTQRSGIFPAIPTLQEAGVPGYEALTWYGVYAPTGTPREAIARTHAELAKALQRPDIKERFDALGVDIVGSTPEHLAKYLDSEIRKWGDVVKAAGLKAD